jgi:acetyl esterase/lipase
MAALNRRYLIKASGVLALGAALVGRSGLAGAVAPATQPPPPAADPLARVHPELKAAAAQLPQMPANFAFTNDILPMVRSSAASRSRAPLPDVSVVERRIPGANGAPDVLVYVINARRDTLRPAILHMHGGGFFIGSAKSDVPDLQETASALDCVIVTVDYRLAPETRWRGSLDDNYAALKWLFANAAELGADRSRIAVMGGSAGGGHAALLAIAARDRGEVPLAIQVLIYPMLDDRTGSTRKVSDHLGAIAWRRQDNVFGWRSFLGQEPGGVTAPAGAVPARVEDLSGLPRASQPSSTWCPAPSTASMAQRRMLPSRSSSWLQS